jgi:hypothetical protein
MPRARASQRKNRSALSHGVPPAEKFALVATIAHPPFASDAMAPNHSGAIGEDYTATRVKCQQFSGPRFCIRRPALTAEYLKALHSDYSPASLPGRAARGSISPRKAACQVPASGLSSFAPRSPTRANGPNRERAGTGSQGLPRPAPKRGNMRVTRYKPRAPQGSCLG